MVKILPNGDIVPDDDPRAKTTTQRPRTSDSRNRQQGDIRQPHFQQNNQQGGAGEQVSLFSGVNQRLTAMGIPHLNLGGMVIEPVVLLGFVLAFLLLGVQGLLLGGLLLAASHWSQNGPPQFLSGILGGDGNNQDNSRTNTRRTNNSGGHRLGHQ